MAFPIVYATDVGVSVRFYQHLGFEPYYQFPEDGQPTYVGMRSDDSDLGVVNARSPHDLLDVEVGVKPRFELFLYVDDVDTSLERLRRQGVPVIREPENMPWGHRLAYVTDPDENPVALAASVESA